MRELSETEKKLALLVIREMDQNGRSLKEQERGASAVLKAFRKSTAAPQPHPLIRLVRSLLFPFSKASPSALPSRRRTSPNVVDLPDHVLTESFLATPCQRKVLVRFSWANSPASVVIKVQTIVELEEGSGFNVIAGDANGPFASREAACDAALAIATIWFDQYLHEPN